MSRLRTEVTNWFIIKAYPEKEEAVEEDWKLGKLIHRRDWDVTSGVLKVRINWALWHCLPMLESWTPSSVRPNARLASGAVSLAQALQDTL